MVDKQNSPTPIDSRITPWSQFFWIPVIGYRNSLVYIQRMIDRIFRPHRKFSKTYIDDIVIFSSFLDEHVKNSDDVFFVKK